MKNRATYNEWTMYTDSEMLDDLWFLFDAGDLLDDEGTDTWIKLFEFDDKYTDCNEPDETTTYDTNWSVKLKFDSANSNAIDIAIFNDLDNIDVESSTSVTFTDKIKVKYYISNAAAFPDPMDVDAVVQNSSEAETFASRSPLGCFFQILQIRITKIAGYEGYELIV